MNRFRVKTPFYCLNAVVDGKHYLQECVRFTISTRGWKLVMNPIFCWIDEVNWKVYFAEMSSNIVCAFHRFDHHCQWLINSFVPCDEFQRQYAAEILKQTAKTWCSFLMTFTWIGNKYFFKSTHCHYCYKQEKETTASHFKAFS